MIGATAVPMAQGVTARTVWDGVYSEAQAGCSGLNRSWSRDAAVGANIARFINHSCTPNCWFEVVDKTIWIRAARTIRRGEQLSYDYSIIG